MLDSVFPAPRGGKDPPQPHLREANFQTSGYTSSVRTVRKHLRVFSRLGLIEVRRSCRAFGRGRRTDSIAICDFGCGHTTEASNDGVPTGKSRPNQPAIDALPTGSLKPFHSINHINTKNRNRRMIKFDRKLSDGSVEGKRAANPFGELAVVYRKELEWLSQACPNKHLSDVLQWLLEQEQQHGRKTLQNAIQQALPSIENGRARKPLNYIAGVASKMRDGANWTVPDTEFSRSGSPILSERRFNGHAHDRT